MLELRPFQRLFLRRAFSPGIDTAALSMPRGNGKSTLAAYVLARCLTPGDPLNVPGAEYVLTAASLPQSRFVFRPFRAELEPRGGYRFIDSVTRVGCTHLASGTKLTVQSSKAKTAMGLVRCPLVVADEPGAWETVGGELMADALFEAQGKPDSPLRILFIGTLAPATAGWWHDLVERGTVGSTIVMSYQGDAETWDSWPTIAKANPLVWRYPEGRKKLLQRRDEARADSRLKARFLSYRLNVPTADESKVLLTVDDWDMVTGRAVPERSGRPVVGVDLGGGRAWSAAVALWESGRCEAIAVAPGIPSIADQERRDRVPRGTYERLVASGSLQIAEGLRVQPPAQLMSMVMQTCGRPARAVCDRFRLAELEDCAPPGLPIEPRISRWSESSQDIRALQKMAKDGPLAVPESSRLLMAASLSAAMVQPDSSGNVRLVKRDAANNTARDDVGAALVLAAGLWDRSRQRPRSRWRYRGIA